MWNLEEPILVVDVETTGLDPYNDVVVSLGAALVERRKITDEFYSLVWPGRKYFKMNRADRAFLVNGLKIKDLVDQPGTWEVSRDFWIWLSGRSKKVTSFNVDFDKKFLQFNPWVIDIPHIRWDDCIMFFARGDMEEAGDLPFLEFWGEYKLPRLSEAEHYYGVKRKGDKHNALEDARAAAGIMLEIERRERNQDEHNIDDNKEAIPGTDLKREEKY